MQKLTEEQITGMRSALAELCDWYQQLEPVTVSAKSAALFDMDSIMGFTYIGPMANPLAVQRLPKVAKLYTSANQKGIPIVRGTENHSENCLEFGDYPPHCIKGSEEAKVVPELEEFEVDLIVYKNSTNAFHEDSLKEWLLNHPKLRTIVFCGFVTEICVMQPAVSIKTYCNNIGREINIVVCEPATTSYDLNIGNLQTNHNADLSHLMALRFMHNAGITIASDVLFE